VVSAPSARKKVCALVALASGASGRSTRALGAMKRIIALAGLAVLGCATTDSRKGSAADAVSVEERDLAAIFAELNPDWKPPKVDLAELEKHPLGGPANPVRVHAPAGERAYLARLRCDDGTAPSFERRGSMKERSPFGFIMDTYNVTCSGHSPVVVYMDMYHAKHVEKRAVPGFSLVVDGT
jgi:hypothetical protein